MDYEEKQALIKLLELSLNNPTLPGKINLITLINFEDTSQGTILSKKESWPENENNNNLGEKKLNKSSKPKLDSIQIQEPLEITKLK